MKSQWMLISALFFALVIAIFAVSNVATVEVNFVFAKTSTPLILVILASTFFGGLAVGSLGMFRVFVLQRKVKLLEKQLAAQSSEVVVEEENKASEWIEESEVSGASELNEAKEELNETEWNEHNTRQQSDKK